jgi:hypothetical protein
LRARLVGQVASDARVSTTELLSQMLDEEASRGRASSAMSSVIALEKLAKAGKRTKTPAKIGRR